MNLLNLIIKIAHLFINKQIISVIIDVLIKYFFTDTYTENQWSTDTDSEN